MRVWPALVLAPLTALAQQSAMYALVPEACNRHLLGGVHAIAALAVLATAGMTWSALRCWLRRGQAETGQEPPQEGRRHTMALVAAMTGAFSTVVCIAMWLPVWMVSPCAV